MSAQGNTQVTQALNSVGSAVTSLTTPINNLQNSVNQLGNRFSNLNTRLSNNRNSLNSSNNALNNSTGFWGTFKNVVTKAGGTLLNVAKSGLSSMIGGLASLAKMTGSVFLVDSLTSALYKLHQTMSTAIKTGIRYNAYLEMQLVNFEVLLGSASKAQDLMDTLVERAVTTPYTTADLVNATQLMMGYGMETGTALEYLDMLGDSAKGNSTYLYHAALAFSQIYAQGKMQGQDALQLINAQIPIWKLLREETGLTMDELRTKMRAGELSFDLISEAMMSASEKGGMFYQSMEKASQTFSGRLSTLKDKVEIFLGKATQPLFDYMRDVAIPGTINLLEHLTKFGSKLKEEVGPVFDHIKERLSQMFDMPDISVTDIIDFFTVSLPDAVDYVDSKIDPFFDTLQGLIDLFRNAKVSTFRDKLLDLLPDGFAELWDNISYYVEGFLNNLRKVGEFIGGTFKPVWDAFVKNFKSINWSPLVDAFNSFLNAAKPLLPVIKLLAGVLGTVLAVALGLVLAAFNGLMSVLPWVYSMIMNVYTFLLSAWTALIGLFTGNTEMLKEGVMNMVTAISDFLWNGLMAIIAFFKTFINTIIDFFVGLYDSLVGHSIIPDMVNGIIEWFQKLFNKGKEIIGNIASWIVAKWTYIKMKATAIWALITATISQALDRVKSYVTNKWEAIKAKISNAMSSIHSKMSSAWNKVKTTVSNALDRVVSYVKTKMAKVVSAIAAIRSKAASKAKSVGNAIKNGIKNVISSAYSWGKNMMNNLISGIGDKIAALKTKVKSAANIVSDFLGFSSPTKEGPGKYADKWMPNLIKMLEEGLLAGAATLQKASSAVASNIKVTPMIDKTVDTSSSSGNTNNDVVINVNANNANSKEVVEILYTKLRNLGIYPQGG
jgi:tape measure domain-containing protein